MKYSLIIPIYNEVETLPLLLKKIKKLNKNIEIIIVDDGSNDGSEILLMEPEGLIIIQNESNLGKGLSVKKGVDSATSQNIILIDGDLEIDIENIPRLINVFEKDKLDVLTGIRWKKIDLKRFDINIFGNYLINALFNFMFNSNFSDVLCCVKIINRNQFKSLFIESNGFNIEVEIMAKIKLKNLNIEEVKVDYKRRTTKQGKKLKLTDSVSIISTIVKMRFLMSKF